MDAKDGTAILSAELQRQTLGSNAQQQQQQHQSQRETISSSSTLTEMMPTSDTISQANSTEKGTLQQPSLTTPEAHWSASSNFSSAPELTLSSEALDQNSFFENIARPYTPSYNSTSGFEDQEDYWSGAGSHFEGVDFEFGEELYKNNTTTSTTFAYDPETADNYNNLDSALLAAQAFTTDNSNNQNSSSSSSATSSALSTQQLAHQTISSPPSQPNSIKSKLEQPIIPIVSIPDQNSFRDPIEKSPFASPQLGATSPIHTRHSSFGSNIGSPAPALEQEPNWMQSLGQRMNLGDDSSKYPRHYYQQPNQQQQQQQTGGYPQQPSQYHQNQQQQHQQTFFAPVFEEESVDQGAIEQQHQEQQQLDDRVYPSYTYSQQGGVDLSQERSHAELSQLPLLSVSDTTMQDAAAYASNVNSVKMEGKGWLPSAPIDWTPNPDNYYPLPFPNNQSGWSQLNHPSQQQQQQQQIAPPPSGTRPTANDGTVQQPKRQDTFDSMRKFLRLDVDMGFVSSQQPAPYQMYQHPGGHEANNWGAVRKRSNSDFGPAYFGLKEGDLSAASPPLFTVVPGGVTDKTPTAMTSGVDWVTETARQRKLQAQAYQSMQNNNPVVMTMQQSQNGHTMDPLMLQQYSNQGDTSSPQQQARHNPASGPVRQRDVSNIRGAAGPYSHSRTSSSGANNGGATPWTPVSPTIHTTNLSNYRPSSLSRSNSANRHRRGAQSEDLSQLARSSNPTEFLNRITAPDGSLAPPNTRLQAPQLSSFANGGNVTMGAGGNSRVNPYRTSHDRHHSNGSNPSNASSPGSNDAYDGDRASTLARQYSNESRSQGGRVGGNMDPPTITKRTGSRAYSQTALPTYTSLGTSSFGEQSMLGPDGTSFHVPVVQVTTSATQAASASRRKNEAIHVCPIPGCGSTFTRKFNLNGHIRSHTGSRPYECREPGCGKSFARSFDLSRHEKLHAGIKPHNCESCGKAFARADALSRHLRNDAGNGGCSAKTIEEEDEEQEGDGDGKELPSGPRMRNGSSASSSLDSMDEVDRQRQERILRQQEIINKEEEENPASNKRESRFKGYVL